MIEIFIKKISSKHTTNKHNKKSGSSITYVKKQFMYIFEKRRDYIIIATYLHIFLNVLYQRVKSAFVVCYFVQLYLLQNYEFGVLVLKVKWNFIFPINEVVRNATFTNKFKKKFVTNILCSL